MKYELIKEYPGSPILGTIAEFANNSIKYTGLDLRVKFSSESFHLIIENHPEFWKPVVEKEYEILSFKATPDTSGIIFKDCQRNEATMNSYLNNVKIGTSKIHSVKRLSDGEVFTIGDMITDGIHTSTICKMCTMDFGTKTDVMMFTFKEPREAIYVIIDTVTKCKQPLFTTEDGVDLYMNDEFYYFNYLQERVFRANVYSNTTVKEGMKFFSTEQKAIDYIIENKPKYSLNDVLKAYDKAYNNSGTRRKVLRDELTKL